MLVNDELNRYYESIIKLIRQGNKEEGFPKYFYNYFLNGNRKFYEKNIIEEKIFDKEWIETLESYLPSIDKIVKNPRSTLSYQNEVVDVARAKKTDSQSVRHLASHTQYIKSVDNGNVTPSKILTTFTEDNFATYENRFIMTLIKRLSAFVENRYRVIKDNVESYQKDHMNYLSDFSIEETNVKITIDIEIIKDLDNKRVNIQNHELLSRVENLSALVKGFKGSQFMQLLAKAHPVNPPIMKTNVILKNPDFRNAYTLWLFLDRYSSLTYDVKVKEKNIPLVSSLEKDLNNMALFAYTSMQANYDNRKQAFENIDEYDEYVRKSTKIVKRYPGDLVKEPDAIMMEDRMIPEYYLDQYKKLFNKRMKDYLAKQDRYDLALKKALRETIDISNMLYDGVFNLEKETDYFKRLITDTDPEVDLQEAKQKAKIAKVIREVKEQDYNNAVKLERRLMRDIDGANRRMLADWKAKFEDETLKVTKNRLEKESAKIKKERANAKKAITTLDSKTEKITKTRDDLKEEITAFNLEMKNRTKAYMASEKAKLKAEIKELTDKHNAEIKAIKAKMAEDALKKKQARQEALKKAKEKADLDQAKAKEQLKAERAKKLAETKALHKAEKDALKKTNK